MSKPSKGEAGGWGGEGGEGESENQHRFLDGLRGINSLQFFPLNFDHRWSMDKLAILAVKKQKQKNEPSIFLREIHQGNSIWAACVQNDVI